MEYYFVKFRDFRVHTKKSPLSLPQGHQADLRQSHGIREGDSLFVKIRTIRG